jgi:hypothetical protein
LRILFVSLKSVFFSFLSSFIFMLFFFILFLYSSFGSVFKIFHRAFILFIISLSILLWLRPFILTLGISLFSQILTILIQIVSIRWSIFIFWLPFFSVLLPRCLRLLLGSIFIILNFFLLGSLFFGLIFDWCRLSLRYRLFIH